MLEVSDWRAHSVISSLLIGKGPSYFRLLLTSFETFPTMSHNLQEIFTFKTYKNISTFFALFDPLDGWSRQELSGKIYIYRCKLN